MPAPPKRESAEADAGFAQTLALGDAITTYLLRAYDRLKQHAASLTQTGGLSERDQIMLSRRIGASFSRRVGKSCDCRAFGRAAICFPAGVHL
jgi:adenylate cyclase class 1